MAGVHIAEALSESIQPAFALQPILNIFFIRNPLYPRIHDAVGSFPVPYSLPKVYHIDDTDGLARLTILMRS